MTGIRIQTLGGLAVLIGGQEVQLPSSRRTRALLAYLLLNDKAHRREHLCELLWWMPDDPRGALRWSLSKLRPIVNEENCERLIADREHVRLNTGDLSIDCRDIAAALDRDEIPVNQLDAILEQLEAPLLDGIDVPDQPLFQEWLNAKRMDTGRLKARALQRLSRHPRLAPKRQLSIARQWSELEPFSRAAAHHLLECLERFGNPDETTDLRAELVQRFRRSGVDWNPPPVAAMDGAEHRVIARQLRLRQKIRFCFAEDSMRIAYATIGEGPPIAKAANWLSHLELDWDAPIWSPLFRRLAKNYRLIRYDERGNGLSDWDVTDLSLEAFVNDLETVVDAAGEERFALLGISQGAAVSIEYAVRHPERVSKLILFGGYPTGWRIDAGADQIREREAIMTLTASGWGQDNPAYRQIFSTTFMPTATPEELEWFNEFQRATTSPENAVRFLSAFGDIDVRHQLAKLRVPTLVIHSHGDQRIPVKTGIDMAAAIPNAEFIGLDSQNHLLLGREPASLEFVNAIREFMRDDGGAASD
ncbi:MAG: alpha/beta fold hydrolase [Wenzhouxiangellaceae bacterium]